MFEKLGREESQERDIHTGNGGIAEKVVHKRKQKKILKRISAAMGIFVAAFLFFTLMKPAITMETPGSHDEVRLICGLEEHVHTDDCFGYDHEESSPVYAVSRELNCSFVPHIHNESCYDSQGRLICGISEEYDHIHDENCYDHGTLVCNLVESSQDETLNTEEVRILICDKPESAGHIHTENCYTITYRTDEEPNCGHIEGPAHVHTEECYGPVLICDEEHEHTEACYITGLVCGLEEGPGHMHTLECYPSMRELTCGQEESEGHVHTDECYAVQTVVREPHIHSEACYENGVLVCGETEKWSHQHTDECWHETRVLVSGGHQHNSECEKVLICGKEEHVHSQACYQGNAEDVEAALQLQGTSVTAAEMTNEENGNLLEENNGNNTASENVTMVSEERGATDPDQSEDESETLISENGEQAADSLDLVSESENGEDYDLVEEAGLLPEEQLSGEENGQSEAAGPAILPEVEGSGNQGADSTAEDNSVTEGAEVFPDNAAPASDTDENPDSENGTGTLNQDTSNTGDSTGDGAEDRTDANPADGNQFDGLTFVKDLVKVDDNVYSALLHADEGVLYQDILNLAGIEAEEVHAVSDIDFLEVEDDYFACRFAFTEGKVVLTAGDTEITVLCVYSNGQDGTASSDEPAAVPDGTETEQGEAMTEGSGTDQQSDLEAQENTENDAVSKENDEASGENAGDATEQTEQTNQQDGQEQQNANVSDENHQDDADLNENPDALKDGQADQNLGTDLDEQQGESEKTGDHDGGEDLTITLTGDGIEGVNAVEEPENAEAVLEIVKAYLDAQEEDAADDSTEASEDAAPKKGRSLLWRVFAVTSEEPFEGSLNVTVPIHADLNSVIPEGASIDLINYRLFLVDPENREVFPVDSFEVVTEAGTVQELNFTADRTGTWVFSVKAEFTEPETSEDETNGNPVHPDTETEADIPDTADEDETGENETDEDKTAAVEIALSGDGIEELKAFFDADHTEAVEEMVNAYLNDLKAASDEQDKESLNEESRQKGTGLFWRVFTIASESEKAYDGNLEVTVPVDVNILEMIPEGTVLASLNYQLFRVDLENSEVMPVGDFEVMSDSESVRSVSFATNVLGTWALVGTVEYAEAEAENQEPDDPAVNTGNVDGTDTEKTVHLAIDLTAYRPEEGSESDAENTGNEFEQSASETEKSENETEESENKAEETENKTDESEKESEEFENKTEESENEAAEESSDSTAEHTEEIPAVEKNESGIALNLAKIFEESAFAEQDGLFAAQYKGILLTLDQIPEETIAFERMQAVSSDDELIYADGKLNINGNGSLEISDGSVSMMIAVTGFEVRNKESAETAEADTEPLNVGIAQITTGDGEGLPVGTEGHAVISEDTSSVDLVKEFLMNQSRRKKMMMAAPRKTAAGSETRYMVFDIEAQAESESGFSVTVDLGENPITGYDFQMYHVHDGMVEPVEVSVSGTVVDEEKGIQEVSQIHFTTGSFSDFVLSYTVDFEYSVNGKMYQFSLPGGGFVSFTDLIEVLGIIGDTNSEESGDEIDASEEQDANGMLDIKASDSAKRFVTDVASVEFSSPELVDVSKVDADTTVGEIKEAHGLECQYSAELTDEQIAEINAQTVEAGDWALISVHPFTTEETLTVAMKDGEVFKIQVTDAVKGTIIADDPVSGKAYAIIVKKDGKYYSVFNDGTLRSVEGAYNPETNKIDVEMDYPLLWNYTSGHVAAHSEGEWWQQPWERYPDHDFDYTNLSIPAEASGFHENHLPNGYYNRYIDPTASNGTSDETKTNSDLRESCTINYNNNHISSGNSYIGISSDGLRIIGNVTEANAAEIYLAETTVPNPDNDTHNDHMVNHIDISIDGASEIRIPLAYGDYQNSSGTTIFTSSEANHIITVTPDISISTSDMKNAVITASAIVDGERKELDDVFYVTGYSQNDKTNQDAKDQLRIEGSFKVSNIPYADNADNRTEICEARKANPIDYSVTVTKTVPVTVKYNGQELYANGQKLVIDVPISLTASFNYWQETNKCPPLHVNYNENGPFNQDWIDGKIMGGTGPAMSGMDFDLAAAAAGSTSKPAIEINKIVQKEDGSYLTTTTTHDVGIEVYYKEKTSGEEDNLIGVGVGEAVDPGNLSGLSSGYMKLHNKDLPVGTSGIGAIYDYDVQPGLIYIKEDPSKVEQYLTGTDGKTYQYVSSRMETEYAWRTNGDEGKIHHADGTASVPEVLGPYAYNGYNLNNTFLPFYIYNVYKEIETVDVPVDKSWPELGDGYTWSATFALQEIEVHESGPVRTDANTSHWVNVEDAGTITIHNGDSEADRTFSNLPKYRYYKNENGEDSVYRIIYSVDELEYELKHNGTTVSKWDKDHGLTVGEDIYAPQFPHDAGDSNDEMHLTEDDSLFNHVIVENHKTDVSVRKELTNLKIQKSWEEGALESAGVDESEAQAVFQLRRYETKTYHEYDTGLYDGSDCVVRLYDKDGGLVQSMTVKKGAKMKVVATFSSSGAIHYMINNSGNDDIQLSWYSGDSTVNSSSFTVTGNIDIKKCVGQSYTPDWSGNVTESHLEYYSSDGSETGDDAVFANEKHYYLVNQDSDWSQTIDSLPLIAESAVHNGQQTVYTYSYYFAEVSSNPSGFYSEFTDGHGNPIGDSGHRVTEDDTMIHALNKSIPPFAVEKEWYSVDDPESYPEIRFTLYQGRINNGRVEQGTVFVDGSGKRYEDIPLNSENNWHWDCPTFLPETDAAGNPVGYYIMEKTSGNNSGHVLLYQNSTLDDTGFIREAGALIDPGTGEKFDVKPLDYYNNKNDNHAKTNDQNFPNGWNGGIAGNEGTLTVLNRTSKYMQMDIKKKILQVDPTDGHVDTIMDEPEKMKDIVLEIQLKRLVFDATTGQQISTDWENYGVPFMIGFDSNNQPIMKNDNNFVLVKQGGFFWRIVLNTTEADQYGYAQNVGLPAYGYYTKEDGTIIPVRYRYIPFEIGVYSDLNKTPAKPEFEWFAGLQPAAWDGNGSQVDTFAPMLPNHDQDRIKNIQASDLYVEKVWEELPTNIQEIYVKLYRSRGENGEREDVTADIAKRTETFSGYGFVEDPSYLTTSVQNGVLVIKPETGEIHLHGLPLVYDTDNYHSQPYYYWVEEVGYKDAKGNIYTDTAKFYPLYDRWDASTGTWGEWTTNGKSAASSLGQVSKNRIRANNAPTTEFKVKKEWYDENGTKLDAPWDSSISSISFSVNRVAQKYTRNSAEDEWTSTGEPEEAELIFDSGSVTGNTITVTSPGRRAQVSVKQSGGTEYSISYMSDADDPEDIGVWATIVDGLQKSHKVSDTELWRYSYKIGKEFTIAQCNTTISNTDALAEGELVTIVNEKLGTSLAIEKTFAGSVILTEEQQKKITFTVTGKFDGTNETTKTFTYGVNSDGYTWNNGVLVIKDIQPGTYTVTEQNDGVDSIFAGDTSGKTYTHTSTCTVSTGTGTVTNSVADATVTEGERTTVSFVNNYDEAQDGALKITKNVTVNGSSTETTQADGTYTFTIASTDAPTDILKYVQITVTNGVAVSYQIADNPSFTDAVSGTGTFVIVSELPEGDYIITETAVEGMTVSSITGGKNNTADTTNRKVTVHVTAGDTTAAQQEASVTFTNNKSLIDLKIIKIDETTRAETNQTKLPNAKFKLYRYSVPAGGSTGTYTVYPDDETSEKTTIRTEGDGYGTLAYESLPDGYYKISETEPPAGYVKTQNNDIYFDIVNGVITRYDKGYTDSSRVEISEETNAVNITYSKSGKSFTVGNAPGAALPNTGGPGTQLFTILGSILILGAGVLLWRRRRLI